MKRRGGDWLGCDVGGSRIKLVRLRGDRVLESIELPTPRGESGAPVADLLARVISEFSATPRGATARGVGVALPGFLDAGRERIVRLANLPAWNGILLRASLERRLAVPVVLDADTNAGAIAEAWTGAGRGSGRVLYLALGTGVGAALVVDRRAVRVAHNTVGHVGHLPVCAPRRTGAPPRTIEDALGARGIVERSRRAGLRRIDSPGALFDRAGSGDAAERRRARAVWRSIGDDLARAAVAVATMLLPHVVVLGGGTLAAAAFVRRRLERGFESGWPPELGPAPRLEIARHGSLAGAIGAAYLARDAVGSRARLAADLPESER